MARTYTWQDALAHVGSQKARTWTDSVMVFAANAAQSMLWEAFDWRETLADLPPFWMNPKYQDYGEPSTEVPDDFLGFRQAWLIDVDGRTRRELMCKGKVNQTTNYLMPTEIGYIPEKSAFRLWPRPPDGVGWTRWLVEATYKKLPTKLTAATLNSTLPWDDRHFHVVCSGLDWALTSSVNPQEKMGAFSVFRSLARDMAVKEGLELGTPPGIAPQDPLVRWNWNLR